MPGRGILCQAFSCNNRSISETTSECHRIRFHLFPKNNELCKKWVINLRNSSLDSLPLKELLKPRRRVCSSHFEDSQYMCPKDRHTSSRVLPTAVPTIVNVPHPPTKPTPRSRPDIDSGPPKTPRVTTDPPSISSAPTCTVSSPRHVRKFRNLQSALSKSRRTVKRLRFVKSIRQAGTSNFDVAKLPEKVRCFFAAQLKAVEVNRSGMRWSPQIIEIALGIKFRSTAAYKFLLSQSFALPSVRTLQRSIEDVCVYSGPCLTLMDLMAKKLNAMKPDDRIATLSLDAMKISPVIRYDESKDFIKGYEEAGSFGRSPKVDDEGMAVMVR